jgi:phosphoribosylformylglycinamidine synthase
VQGYAQLEVPIAHGEGRFICKDEATLQQLETAGQVVLRYCDEAGNPGPYPINPNGSQADIAGICDATGQVLGLMPHPERHVLPTQHPQWTRQGLKNEGDGLRLFKNAVNYFLRW